MSPNQAVDDARKKFDLAVDRFQENLKSLRTGRANPAMLDGVMVEAYGTTMPLNQVATVTAPEAQLLQISPFDPNNIQAISAAIRNNQQLGLNPSDDGRVVRLPVPPLTEERRRELAKQVGQKHEECMVALRNVRHEALDITDRAKKNKELSEDDAKRQQAQIEEAMTRARAVADAAAKSKEAALTNQ